MQWVASTPHTTPEHGVSSITTADAAQLGCQQSNELTPTGRFKWTSPFRLKTKSGFCAFAITFRTRSSSFGAGNSCQIYFAISKIQVEQHESHVYYATCIISPII